MSVSAAAPDGVANSVPDAAPPIVAGSKSDRLDLTVAGMTCGHCVHAVRSALESLPGVNVHHVRVGSASITLDPNGASPATVIQSIREAGYQAGFVDPSIATAEPARRAGLPQRSVEQSCCSTR